MRNLALILIATVSLSGAYTPKDCAPGHPKGMNGPTQPK